MKQIEAKEWLQDFLADGPVAVKKIQEQARAAGLSWMTVRRARETLPVTASKNGYQGSWHWQLKGAHSKDAHSADMSAFDASDDKLAAIERSTAVQPEAGVNMDTSRRENIRQVSRFETPRRRHVSPRRRLRSEFGLRE